jgi:hypothetical protein
MVKRAAGGCPFPHAADCRLQPDSEPGDELEIFMRHADAGRASELRPARPSFLVRLYARIT